jgi:hypothetical protein
MTSNDRSSPLPARSPLGLHLAECIILADRTTQLLERHWLLGSRVHRRVLWEMVSRTLLSLTRPFRTVRRTETPLLCYHNQSNEPLLFGRANLHQTTERQNFSSVFTSLLLLISRSVLPYSLQRTSNSV